MTGVDLADSHVFGHLWATAETRALLDDRGRTRAWLRILGTLASVQGELGLIPEPAAREIAERAGAEELDLEAVGEETRRSGHSTLGLIRVLQRELGPEAREWLCHGATVQDVSDTWTALVIQRMLTISGRDLTAIEEAAARPRRAPSPHADAGADARAAGAADHVRPQGGAVGGRGRPPPGARRAGGAAARGRPAGRSRRHPVGLGTAGARAAAGRATLLGLGVPEVSWTAARDRVAEFTSLLALITGTLAKIGNEVYNLQRAEIAEVSEAPTPGVVGSITMPQKRNPERSEHLWTLARVVRSQAALAIECMVAEHERDGAAWKTEWVLVPRACTAAAVALALGAELVAGLRVDAARMRANLDAQRGYVLAEPVVLALAPRVGRHRAHELVSEVAQRGQERGLPLLDALAAEPAITEHLPAERLDELLRPESALGAVDALIDRVVARGRDR